MSNSNEKTVHHENEKSRKLKTIFSKLAVTHTSTLQISALLVCRFLSHIIISSASFSCPILVFWLTREMCAHLRNMRGAQNCSVRGVLPLKIKSNGGPPFIFLRHCESRAALLCLYQSRPAECVLYIQIPSLLLME